MDTDYQMNMEDGRWVDLPVRQKLQRIRMKWDLTTSKMSFSDPKTNQTIGSWKLPRSVLFPFFRPTDAVPLKISRAAAVTVGPGS